MYTNLVRNNVSDKKYKQITHEMQKYREIKPTLRTNFSPKKGKKKKQFTPANLHKTKQRDSARVSKKFATSSTNLS